MALNLGVKVFLILMCVSFVFSIAPNDASPLGYGYGTGWNKIQQLFAGTPCATFGSAASCGAHPTCSWIPSTSTCAGTYSDHNSTMLVWLGVVLGVAGVAVLASTATFPNAFTLFSGVVGAFAGFVTVPWDLLGATNNLGFGAGSDVGAMIPGFFVVAMVFMVFIVIFAMFKGTDF